MKVEILSADELLKAQLTARGRKRITSKNFALPGGRYPIHDEAHARNALARVSQFGTPEEKAKVRAAVHRKYPEIGKSVRRRNGEKFSQYKVRRNMHEMKDHPEKYPGGRKQAIAIGLNQARREGKKAMIKGEKCKKCGELLSKCMCKSEVEKAGKGAGSRGGKISRYTKGGKPVYAAHDHKLASRMSQQAYDASDRATSIDSYSSAPNHVHHAAAARAHLAAAFYAHHGGDKVAAKEHLHNAEHHHEEAEAHFKVAQKHIEDAKKRRAETNPSESQATRDNIFSRMAPSKTYDHKFVDKHIDATRAMIRGKHTSKSLAKAMQEERDNTMDIEAIFKGEQTETEDPMIEVTIGDGEDAQTRLLPFSEIQKSIDALRKGKKRKARTVAHENATGRTTHSAGKPTSSRPGGGVERQPKQSHVTTKKGEGEDAESASGGDVKKGGKCSTPGCGGVPKPSSSACHLCGAPVKKGGEGEQKPSFRVLKGTAAAMLVENNTEFGDAAIAKSIAEANGLGAGAIPSSRNTRVEANNK